MPFKKRIEESFDDLKEALGKEKKAVLEACWVDWVEQLTSDIVEDVTERRRTTVPEQCQALLNFLVYIRECY